MEHHKDCLPLIKMEHHKDSNLSLLSRSSLHSLSLTLSFLHLSLSPAIGDRPARQPVVIESGWPSQHIRLIQLILDRDRTTSLSNLIRPISKTEDAKERALEKLSINVCGKQLLIFRIDAPRTTVVRISNLYSAEAKKKLFSICRSYGKVKVVVFRHKEIRDVHFMLSVWPNMLKILNRLNGLKVDDCRIIAQPALVFPPEVLRVLWSHPDERQRLETTIWMKTLLYTSMYFLANLRIGDPMLVQHVQTPEGSLLDTLRNAYDLLSHCDIKIPKIEGNDKYVDSGPPYLIFLHPALGPLWEVTRQKFHGGSISKGSELQIEVAEFSWRNVQLHGSLIVVAENILGSTRMDENGELKLRYWHRCGRCKLQNVKVLNEGIDWTSRNNTYWKHDVQRFEALKVILHGNAEFEATDVVFQYR